MSLQQWEEIQEVLPCFGAAWIDQPRGCFAGCLRSLDGALEFGR